MAIEDFYDNTAVVQQATNVRTNMGGNKKVYTTRIASLSCRLSIDRRDAITETDQYGKRTIREYWRLYCEASTANKAIELNDRVTADGKTFEVEGGYNPAIQNHHLEIRLLEVR